MQILYSDTCFTAQALVRLMVDINDKTVEFDDRVPEKEEPRFTDVVAVFTLLAGPLVGARQLLEVSLAIHFRDPILAFFFPQFCEPPIIHVHFYADPSSAQKAAR